MLASIAGNPWVGGGVALTGGVPAGCCALGCCDAPFAPGRPAGGGVALTGGVPAGCCALGCCGGPVGPEFPIDFTHLSCEIYDDANVTLALSLNNPSKTWPRPSGVIRNASSLSIIWP
jgi:hypothetical protein